MGFEVNISNGNCAVTQKAKLPLHVQLLEEEDAVAGGIHGVPGSKGTRCSSHYEIRELPKAQMLTSHHRNGMDAWHGASSLLQMVPAPFNSSSFRYHRWCSNPRPMSSKPLRDFSICQLHSETLLPLINYAPWGASTNFKPGSRFPCDLTVLSAAPGARGSGGRKHRGALCAQQSPHCAGRAALAPPRPRPLRK